MTLEFGKLYQRRPWNPAGDLDCDIARLGKDRTNPGNLFILVDPCKPSRRTLLPTIAEPVMLVRLATENEVKTNFINPAAAEHSMQNTTWVVVLYNNDLFLVDASYLTISP